MEPPSPQRILSFFNCHPVSKPCFPDMSDHHLWKVLLSSSPHPQTWDAVVEEFLRQLYQSQASRKSLDVISRDVELVTAAPAASDGVEETHDPYAHIRRVPAAGASASRPFDRCSADVLATTVRSAFSFHTSFFRSALQELYSFVGVRPERDVGASVAADERDPRVLSHAGAAT